VMVEQRTDAETVAHEDQLLLLSVLMTVSYDTLM
jgi:hypothetical protein